MAVGDVITQAGTLKIESGDALVAAVRSAVPNSAVDVTYLRGSVQTTVSVSLGSSAG